MSARRLRYRVNWRGRLILQVCVTEFVQGLGMMDRWRDARVSDMGIGPIWLVA